jgi:hypothetical protein
MYVEPSRRHSNDEHGLFRTTFALAVARFKLRVKRQNHVEAEVVGGDDVAHR